MNSVVNNQKEKCTQSVVESVCSNCNLITNTQTTNNNGNNNNNNIEYFVFDDCINEDLFNFGLDFNNLNDN